jgi:quercetin 2,3-dioxygenase
MISIRKKQDRGHAHHGWLDTYHTFSFADYFDHRFMGFRALRVINEDRVAPASGFPTHPHQNMEIISYVMSGALQHRDSMGNGSVIRPGEVQRMSAGTGVTHSEANQSKEESVHFFQIWILPAEAGRTPGYEQKYFPDEEKKGRLRMIASEDGRDGSLTIGQDVNLFAGIITPGGGLVHAIPRGRHAWLQVARGRVILNGTSLDEGDGAAVSEEDTLRISAVDEAEVLLFDLV